MNHEWKEISYDSLELKIIYTNAIYKYKKCIKCKLYKISFSPKEHYYFINGNYLGHEEFICEEVIIKSILE